MRIPRIFVDTRLQAGAAVTLAGSSASHVTRVLRLRSGDKVILFDGHGGEWRAELADAGKGQVVVHLLEHLACDRESPLRWELVQGISRGERMDYTLQKAVELGVAAIHPVEMQRTVVKLDAARAEKRIEHWNGVCRSAAEQSGRTAMPVVHPVCRLHEFLAREIPGTMLMLDPESAVSVSSLPAARPASALLVAGPEGGFDDHERKLLLENGATALRLGPRILRTETAALVAAALLLARWGDY